MLAESVWPSIAKPLITGRALFTGAGAGVTVAVAAEVALVEPPVFVAVTTTRRVCPTSVEASL